jgi:prepilin-type N-terminal cleavage/methylation domain-containing protein
MHIRIRKAAAFTLIEVMVVVALVGMLAGISVPSFMKARDSANLNVIRSNLRMIDDVKQQWAVDTRATKTSVPNGADLAAYLRGNEMPESLVGETYFINSVENQAAAVIPLPMAGLPAGATITL